MNADYGDEPAEYRAALEAAVLFDLGERGKVTAVGPDARLFLHNLCTNAVKDLPAGAGCEAFLTTAKARIVAHVWVSHLDGEPGPTLLLDTAAGQAEKVLAHLNHYLITEQVELADRSRDLGFLRLCGPESARLLAAALGQTLPALGLLHHARLDWPGVGPVQVRRQELLALDGLDLFCPAAAVGTIRARLVEVGVRPAGPLTYDVLRVEAGLPEQGVDFDDERLAMEVGRTPQAISYAKGCYLGQETIVMARDRGQLNRQLLGVTVPAAAYLAAGTRLYHGTDEVGQVTSSVLSPRLGRVAALAYLRRGCQTPGTQLQIESPTSGRWASVTALPFVAPAAGERGA